MLSHIALSIVIIALFLYAGIQYTRLAEPKLTRFLSRRVTDHSRLGPVLFILLAAVTAYLGYWEPSMFDSQFTSDVDSRISFIVNGFAPFTAGIAIWGIFSYVRLFRIQWQSPTSTGRILLAVLALPLAGSIYTGSLLAEPAVFFLPSFVEEILHIPFEWLGL